MRLDVVLPTKWRQAKLNNCLNSIFHSLEYVSKEHQVELYVYFSEPEEFDYNKEVFKEVPFVHICFVEKYRVPNFWNKFLRNTQADGMLYLNDDVLLEEDFFCQVLEEFPQQFPDFDGVMGVRQVNLPKDQTVEGAFGIIGKKYAERFPEKQVFCPDYDRFYGDFEVWRQAEHVKKFYFCSTARIIHLHPCTDKNLEDDTHKDVRTYLRKDKETYSIRQQRNWLWGRNYDLVNKVI